MKNKLWVEKYRPNTIADYVFVDERQKKQVQGWVRDGSIPHLLLSGDPGTGKTTLAKVLIHELGVEEYYSSKEGQVATARYTINNVKDEDMQLEIGWQNSYNKTLSLKYAIGASIFICANGCVTTAIGDIFSLKCASAKFTSNQPVPLPST